MLQVATALGLLMALPMAFVIVLTQVNGLQDTARSVVPTAIDPVFGTTTFIILILCLVIGTVTVMAAGALAFKG